MFYFNYLYTKCLLVLFNTIQLNNSNTGLLQGISLNCQSDLPTNEKEMSNPMLNLP